MADTVYYWRQGSDAYETHGACVHESGDISVIRGRKFSGGDSGTPLLRALLHNTNRIDTVWYETNMWISPDRKNPLDFHSMSMRKTLYAQDGSGRYAGLYWQEISVHVLPRHPLNFLSKKPLSVEYAIPTSFNFFQGEQSTAYAVQVGMHGGLKVFQSYLTANEDGDPCLNRGETRMNFDFIEFSRATSAMECMFDGEPQHVAPQAGSKRIASVLHKTILGALDFPIDMI